VLLGSPAGASVPRTSTTFCTAASKIQSSSRVTSKSSPAAWTALAKAYKEAASSAPPKIASALRAMADYAKSLAAGKAATNGERYANAAVTLSSYIGKTCQGTLQTPEAP
jgi:hypothetical protein